jgi:hypothetical protein
MKSWRFNSGSGFVYAPGNTVEDARKKASKVRNVYGGERAGYFKDGYAAYYKGA